MKTSRVLSCFAIGSIISVLLVTGLTLHIITDTLLHPRWYRESSGGRLRVGWPEALVQGDPRRLYGLPYEDVEFPASYDGNVTIRGWWVPAPSPSDVVIVAVHGSGGNRREYLRQVKGFILNDRDPSASFNMLLFDCVGGSGESDRPPKGQPEITFGRRESKDVLAAAAFAKQTKGMKSVIAIGHSLGASAVLMAGGSTEGKELIDMVIAENPFASFEDVFREHAPKRLRGGRSGTFQSLGPHLGLLVGRLLDGFVSPVLVDWVTSYMLWRLEYEPRAQPKEVVHRISPRPLMLIHGKDDHLCPFSHSLLLFERASEPKEFWEVSTAAHAVPFDTVGSPRVYHERVRGFIHRHLTGNVASHEE
ncbi:hypothetical protein QOT17_016729 [Balamuthia mandrillaris]